MRAIVLLILAVACSGARAGIVYSQPTTPNAANVGFGFYSHTNPRPQNNYKHADNFTLAADAAITEVSWWGMSSVRNFTNLNNFDQFTVEFFASSGSPSLPGALIASQTFTRAATTPTDTGRRAPSGAIEYAQHATLTTPVALSANTEYYFAVSARCVNVSGDAYLWQDSDTFDGYTVLYNHTTHAWAGFVDTDSSFVLHAVPAPGCGAVLVAGIAGMARRRR
ncbi:MAG TPA: hypothetical protein VHN77_14370 [Phycisphaerales bacterium]|nr:hypothetical protein [Phycisphaerales bacterium]